MRARAESFGAWVRTDDATLIAIDRATAAKLGIDGKSLWRGDAPSLAGATPVAPLEAHVAVTARCPVSCSGCYQDASPSGAHVDEAALFDTLDRLARQGVFTVAFGGGEPITHPSLPRLAEHARARGLVPVVTTSGIGLTRELAQRLRGFAQVNVSHDGVGGAYEAVRGFDAANVAERAIALLVEAGVTVGINVVLTRASFDRVEATCARAATLGAREVQLLRYKPAGRAASLDYLAQRLWSSQVDALPAVVRRLVARGDLSVRIDCAMVPLLSRAFDDPSSLVALGVFGCEANRSLGAVKPDGRDAPCSFLDAEHRDRWRDVTIDAAEPCRSCALRSICRGGCRVVAEHLAGDAFAPDPECPRVVAHHEGRA
jgi:radical SAM protein with 4Fe4S-binding SPASM domain